MSYFVSKLDISTPFLQFYILCNTGGPDVGVPDVGGLDVGVQMSGVQMYPTPSPNSMV